MIQKILGKMRVDNKMSKYLITKEFLEEQYKAMGEQIFKGVFVTQARCSGKSTAMAFNFIRVAIDNPGKEYYIQDHNCTRQADNNLYCMIERMIDKLDLKGFEFNRIKGTIRFNLYEIHPESFLKDKVKGEIK